MATEARKNDFATLVRQQTRVLWDTYHSLLSLQDEWDAQDYTASLASGLAGENAEITVGQLSSVVFDTTNAVKVLMDGGHATNVTNIL
jgi:hypothetical protein